MGKLGLEFTLNDEVWNTSKWMTKKVLNAYRYVTTTLKIKYLNDIL